MINKPKSECETKLCQYESLTRTRFYNGMLLTAEHLRAEQNYHRESLKRLNRNLFGSGIVCGLEVKTPPRGLCLTINPGVAIDCCGNLIEVCKCITVDLSKACKDEYGPGCQSPPNQNDDKPRILTRYLVLRYSEQLTDPEQVFTPGDECKPAGEKPNCEASKVREGYCIELWDQCPCPEEGLDPTDKSLLDLLRESRQRTRQTTQSPAAGTNLPANQDQAAANAQSPLAQQSAVGQTAPSGDGVKTCIDLPLPCVTCGCCEDSNAVGLATLEINCTDGIVDVKKCGCRRYVISPRLLAWVFSKFPLSKHIPAEMNDVKDDLGHHVIRQMMGTAIGFESHGDKIEGHRVKIDDHEQRLLKLEEPPPPPTENVAKTRGGAAKKEPAAPEEPK